MIDATPNEKAAIVHAGAMGGEYLESIGKSDLAQLDAEEWLTFVEAIVTAFADRLNELIEKDNARLDGVRGSVPLG